MGDGVEVIVGVWVIVAVARGVLVRVAVGVLDGVFVAAEPMPIMARTSASVTGSISRNEANNEFKNIA